MQIGKAKLLTVGSRVVCPADRGDAPFHGKVTWVGTEERTTLDGQKYIQVEVENLANGRKAVWPSNRLGVA